MPKEAGFPDVAKLVEPRTGHTIYWNQGSEADAAVEKTTRAMLAHPLSAAEAVQIALLNNHALQATYEDLTIGQADLVQAGLLQNPVFSASVRFSLDGFPRPYLDFDVEQDFLSILLIPARKRLAAAAFEGAKLRVGHAVIELTYEVRAAYFSLQGTRQIATMRRTILDTADASLDLATRQHEAGNISDADLANEQALHMQIQLDLTRSRGEILAARERLMRLMGLWGVDAGWTIAERLPDLPAVDPRLEDVESVAIQKRLDVAAARWDFQMRSSALEMAHDFRWIGGAAVGAHFERDQDGKVIGPSARIELPIFDQKQATIAKLEAELQQSRARLQSLAVAARSEVREARGRVQLARELADHYRAEVIPLRERLVALTQQQYDAMLVGVYQLLATKQNEVNAYREYIETVRDYWVARADLDRAAGGRITGPASATPRPAAPAAAPMPMNMPMDMPMNMPMQHDMKHQESER